MRSFHGLVLNLDLSLIYYFFYDNSDEINFKIQSTGGDDLCPNSFTITMKDGKKYENRGMNDMVDNKEGKNLRTSKRKLGENLPKILAN